MANKRPAKKVTAKTNIKVVDSKKAADKKKTTKLKGYLENISDQTFYALKRSIKPGDRVPLEYVYNIVCSADGADHKKDKSFVDVVKEKFNNGLVWNVVYGSEGKSKMSGKVRATGGVVQASSADKDINLNSEMSKVTGVIPAQDLPEITPHTLLDAKTPEEIETIASYIKSPKDKKRILTQAAYMARTKGGKELHYRVINKIMEKNMIR